MTSPTHEMPEAPTPESIAPSTPQSSTSGSSTPGSSTARAPASGAASAFDPRVAALVVDDPEALPAVACDCLVAERLRQRFSNPPRWSPEMTGDRIRLHVGPPRPAAVLLPIVLHADGPAMLLTQRTAHLRQHSGQVAFPGGRHEPADRTPVHTALREAHEEVGLEPSRVEVIGRLPEYLTGTGFQVTPVVGLVEPGFEVRPDPHEVAAVFEVPLEFLMDPRHHQRRLIEVAGERRIFWAMPWRPHPSADEYFIWGATAAMLRNLYRLLSA